MRRVNLMGDPSIVAQECERWENYRKKTEQGTGCHTCKNAETAWGQTYCMISERHPDCVYRGMYRHFE